MLNLHGVDVRSTLLSDFEALLAMKSDPEEVRWSGFAGPPDRRRFLQWFEQALVNSDRVMFTGLVDEVIRGYVHFHRLGPSVFGVSTGVVSGFRGRGIGTAFRRLSIDALRATFRDVEIEAWLAEGNVASQRSWAKMGYRPTDTIREHQFLCPARTETMRRWVQSDPTRSR